MTTEKIWKADVSSVSPSSERMEELWVVVGFYEGAKEPCQVLLCLLRDLSKDQLSRMWFRRRTSCYILRYVNHQDRNMH